MTPTLYISAIAQSWKRFLGFLNRESVNERIERAEPDLLKLPQVEMPLTHRFAPNVYFREILMPAGTFVIGHEHRTEHFNVVLTGRASVSINGKVHEIKAPCVFVSKPGVRKILFIHEDMRWATIHPTSETNLDRLETLLIKKSDAFKHHELTSPDAEKLRIYLSNKGGLICHG